MAKGIGNGFPLAAVVTTPEIASCMSRAVHFNTYGGNPLASAVGISVLDVSEHLYINLFFNSNIMLLRCIILILLLVLFV